MHSTPNLLHKSTNSKWKILFGSSYEAPKGRDFPLHSHKYWEWVYYRSGYIQAIHGGEQINMRPGSLWLTPPNTPHAEIAKTAYSSFFFTIDAPANTEAPKIVQDDADGSMGRLLQLVFLEMRCRLPHQESMVALLTEALSIHIQRGQNKEILTKSKRLVRDAESLWSDSLRLSVEEVAQQLGASVSNLRQSFQKEYKQSPITCRTRLRIEKALRLLHTSTLKLEAIAELCGFDSSSHLSRHIKAFTGQYPGGVRAVGNMETDISLNSLAVDIEQVGRTGSLFA